MIKCHDAIFFEDILGYKDYAKGGLAVGRNILNEPLEENQDMVYEEIRPDNLSEQAMSVQFHALLSAYNTSTTEDTIRLRALATITQPISTSSNEPSTILGHMLFDFKVPRSFKAAMKSNQKEHWYRACTDEINALKWNKIWRVVPRPNDVLVIQHKWVFDVKVNPDSLPPSVSRFKARLVARGDSQTKGINFDEVYAPVIRFTSLRIILHIAATLDLEIVQGDFVNAFLNGKLSEKGIYMTQPEGFKNLEHPDWVCELDGNIYGLRQGARVWYECLDTVLRTYGMTRTEADQALWLKILVFLLAHVDDILIVGNKNETAGIKTYLSSVFKFKDLGDAHHFLGLVITRDRKNRRLYIDQAPYIREILGEFKMENCIPVSIPMDPKETWEERLFLNGACISWTSKRQGLVALSSTEAEFIAGTEAVKELC